MKKILALLFLFSNTSYSQTIDQTKTVYKSKGFTTEIKKAESLVNQLMIDKHIPGLSICIATKDNIVWVQGFGYADIENEIPVKINSKFRIGSISKTLTALALSKLIEANKINLGDNIKKYVDYFPEKVSAVSIGQLASHTAGIRDYNFKKNEFMSDARYNTIKESINIFKDDTLLFTPGTKFGYSTYGYVLLSAAIETAAGENYLNYMNEKVFAPMNLTNTIPDYNDSLILNRVSFYDELKGKLINGIHVDNSNKWAGGGFLSTSYDLAKMSQNLLNYKFLNKNSVEILWTPSSLSNGQKINYGIGWRTDKDSLQRKYVYHGGSSVGGRSFLLVYPQEQLIIAITCNLSTNFDQAFVLKLSEIFFKLKIQ